MDIKKWLLNQLSSFYLFIYLFIYFRKDPKLKTAMFFHHVSARHCSVLYPFLILRGEDRHKVFQQYEILWKNDFGNCQMIKKYYKKGVISLPVKLTQSKTWLGIMKSLYPWISAFIIFIIRNIDKDSISATQSSVLTWKTKVRNRMMDLLVYNTAWIRNSLPVTC